MKEPECLNCGHPFSGHEIFCPDCGQKNKGKSITFGSFVTEVFNGFISWDAKFWTTIIPLLTKPGKVSKDFILGKRARYSNPFQFYLTTSIIFFLIFGAIDSYTKFNDYSKGKEKVKKEADLNELINNKTKNIDVDSLKTVVDKQLKNSFIPIDSVKRKEILKEIEEKAKDTTNGKNRSVISFGGDSRLDKFIAYHNDHPDTDIDSALDSLGYEKNFKNRFLYDRGKISSSFLKKNERDEFVKEMTSYASISLFILLPIFTLSLKFFYIRRKYTYVEHLIFVFHTQTVFFLLLTLFIIVNFFTKSVEPWVFILLFLIYLFLAMKKFYNQGYFKTFLKFMLINGVYMFLAGIGVTVVALISFAFF